MHILRLHRLAATLALIAFLAGIASAANFSFTGTFSQDDDQLQFFTFTVNAASTVTLRTWSYGGERTPPGKRFLQGGFDPFLSLFNSTGFLIAENGVGVATEQSTGLALDTYTLVSTESDNQPKWPDVHKRIYRTRERQFCRPTLILPAHTIYRPTLYVQ